MVFLHDGHMASAEVAGADADVEEGVDDVEAAGWEGAVYVNVTGTSDFRLLSRFVSDCEGRNRVYAR